MLCTYPWQSLFCPEILGVVRQIYTVNSEPNLPTALLDLPSVLSGASLPSFRQTLWPLAGFPHIDPSCFCSFCTICPVLNDLFWPEQKWSWDEKLARVCSIWTWRKQQDCCNYRYISFDRKLAQIDRYYWQMNPVGRRAALLWLFFHDHMSSVLTTRHQHQLYLLYERCNYCPYHLFDRSHRCTKTEWNFTQEPCQLSCVAWDFTLRANLDVHVKVWTQRGVCQGDIATI